MRVTLNDGRQMTGQMLAFDKVRGTFFELHSSCYFSNRFLAYESSPRRY
jgi:hypothetical protein